jgi:hypothetical protein
MKCFMDALVHGNSDVLDKFIPAVESRLESTWDRDLDTERRAAQVEEPRLFLFRCRRASGDLGFVLARYPDVIAVDDIRVYLGKVLTAPEYSEVLEDFFWSTLKPVADQLGLKYFSSAFDSTPPAWARRRHYSAIEIALGWRVARQLLKEGYIRRFPLRDHSGGAPVDGRSIMRRLVDEMSLWSQN